MPDTFDSRLSEEVADQRPQDLDPTIVRDMRRMFGLDDIQYFDQLEEMRQVHLRNPSDGSQHLAQACWEAQEVMIALAEKIVADLFWEDKTT